MVWSTDPPSSYSVKLRKDVAHKRTEIVLYAFRALIFRTPVKTGRARSGWTVGVGGIRAIDRGEGQEFAAAAEGIATINASRSRPYESVYISNNVPYIYILETGTSMQAPMGFLNIVANDLRLRYS